MKADVRSRKREHQRRKQTKAASAVEQALDIDNATFLHALFGTEHTVHLCCFGRDPTNAKSEWAGYNTRLDRLRLPPTDCNTYYSVALFPVGARRRLKDTALAVVVIVIDDSGEALPLPPSYRLQTSPQSQQAGFILKVAVPVERTEQLIRHLGAKKLLGADPSGNNAVRYVRLPQGMNTKAKYGTPFQHQLLEWNPERRYSIEEIERAFGLGVGGTTKGSGEDHAPPRGEQAFSPFPPTGGGLEWEGHAYWLRENLHRLSAGKGHKRWMEVCMGIHHASGGSEEGFQIFHNWSRDHHKGEIGEGGQPVYRGEKDCRYQWKDLTRRAERIAKRIKAGQEVKFTPITIASVYKLVQDAMGEAKAGEQEQRPIRLPITFADLAASAQPPLAWFVDNVLAPGAHALCGPPKVGKGYFILQALDVLEKGGQLLGHDCKGGTDCAYFAAEDNEARIKRRVERTQVRLERTVLVVQNVIESLAKAHAGTTPHEFVRHFLLQHPQIKVLVLDSAETYRAIWRGEKLDNEGRARPTDADYQAARLYDRIGLELGVCIILVNHTGKRKTHGGGDFHERTNKTNAYFAGLTASLVMDWPDGADTSDPKEKRRVVATRSREAERDEVSLIAFNESSQFDYCGEYREANQTALMKEILRAVVELQAGDERVTAKLTAEHMGCAQSTVKTTVQRAMRAKPKQDIGEVDGVAYRLVVTLGRNGGYHAESTAATATAATAAADASASALPAEIRKELVSLDRCGRRARGRTISIVQSRREWWTKEHGDGWQETARQFLSAKGWRAGSADGWDFRRGE